MGWGVADHTASGVLKRGLGCLVYIRDGETKARRRAGSSCRSCGVCLDSDLALHKPCAWAVSPQLKGEHLLCSWWHFLRAHCVPRTATKVRLLNCTPMLAQNTCVAPRGAGVTSISPHEAPTVCHPGLGCGGGKALEHLVFGSTYCVLCVEGAGGAPESRNSHSTYCVPGVLETFSCHCSARGGGITHSALQRGKPRHSTGNE